MSFKLVDTINMVSPYHILHWVLIGKYLKIKLSNDTEGTTATVSSMHNIKKAAYQDRTRSFSSGTDHPTQINLYHKSWWVPH